MCGICGLVFSNPETPVDREMLARMTDAMFHRGPDSRGFYVSQGVGLGIRRLSIIDLQTGDQPISNEDGTVTIICNGEIYNFRELRNALKAAGHSFRTNSDAEVIVHLYEDHGAECVNHLRGMFGFALWDKRRRRLMLARDRLGIKPLFYALEKDALFFGSELKSILMSGCIERSIDVHALQQLLTLGYVLGPKTLLGKIRQLLPGHYLLYQNGLVTIQRYWEPTFPVENEPPGRSADEWAEGLRAKLQETVKIHLRSDVPVGAFLSSGVDSSGIVSLMSRFSNHPVQTFSIGFENPAFDEVSRQKILSDFTDYPLLNERAVCRTKDVDIIEKAVWHREDPTAVGINIPLMILSQLASRKVKVVLTGEGSDEVFGGYRWFRTVKLLRPLMMLPLGIRQWIAEMPGIRKRTIISKLVGMPAEMNLIRYKYLSHTSNLAFTDQIFSDDLKQELMMNGDSHESPVLPANFHRWHPFIQLQYFELTLRLPNLIIRNLDAASMAYSLEARVPFLDHELVEYCARIPESLKMRRLQEKHILRRALREDLPLEILRRRKRGLMLPLSEWMRNLNEPLLELLSEESVRTKGYFNPEYVRFMLQKHLDGNVTYTKSLMCVVGVHLWDNLFVRNRLTNSTNSLAQRWNPSETRTGSNGYKTNFDLEYRISSLVETACAANATNLFVHCVTSLENTPNLIKIKPELENYPERALVFARRDDIVCVLEGVDSHFLQFLSNLGVGPYLTNIVSVRRSTDANPGANLSELLGMDHQALSILQNLLTSRKKIVFHPYVASRKEFTLACVIEEMLGAKVPVLGGDPAVVKYASLKHHVKMKAADLGIPVPDGKIVELECGKNGKPSDLTPIQDAIGRYITRTGRVIIKGTLGTSASSIYVLENNLDSVRKTLSSIAERSDNTIYIVEPMLDVTVSPNILMHVQPDNGRILCVGVTDQILKNTLGHIGNIYPSQARTLKEMIHSASTVSKWLQSEGYSGPVGFDFMEYKNSETGKFEHFLAEVNPRINASTYPRSLMEHLNKNQLERNGPFIEAFVAVDKETTARSFLELKARYGHLFFNPETGRGLFPYNIGCLKYGKFTVAIFGDSRDSVVKMYEAFSTLTGNEY